VVHGEFMGVMVVRAQLNKRTKSALGGDADGREVSASHARDAGPWWTRNGHVRAPAHVTGVRWVTHSGSSGGYRQGKLEKAPESKSTGDIAAEMNTASNVLALLALAAYRHGVVAARGGEDSCSEGEEGCAMEAEHQFCIVGAG
jgi:hypothetical protein